MYDVWKTSNRTLTLQSSVSYRLIVCLDLSWRAHAWYYVVLVAFRRAFEINVKLSFTG